MLCPLLRRIYSSRPASAKCLSTLIRVPAQHDGHCRPQSSISFHRSPERCLSSTSAPLLSKTFHHTHTCFLDSTRASLPSPTWRFPAVRHKRRNKMTLRTTTLGIFSNTPANFILIVASRLAYGALLKVCNDSDDLCLSVSEVCDMMELFHKRQVTALHWQLILY
jgi:hypothetical protein